MRLKKKSPTEKNWRDSTLTGWYKTVHGEEKEKEYEGTEELFRD